MPAQNRTFLKIFANNSNNVGQFGSFQANGFQVQTATKTKNLETIQNLAAWLDGWDSATAGGDLQPSLQELNALTYVVTSHLNYIYEKGFVEYSSSQPYFIDSIVRPAGTTLLFQSKINDNLNISTTATNYDAGTTYDTNDLAKEAETSNIYRSLTNGNIGNPLTNTGNWQLVWEFLGDLAIIKNLKSATEAIEGTAQIATQTEVNTGTNDAKIVTPLKLNNRVASETLSGITSIATDAEVFNKNTDKIVTGQKLFNSVFFHQWSVGNGNTGLAQVVPTGTINTVGYNLLSSFLEANESQTSNVPLNFKNTAGAAQATILDETNNRLLFPSNLQTFNAQYIGYFIRVNLIIDYGTTNNLTTKFRVRLRRAIDDSIVATAEFIQSDFVAEAGVPLTGAIFTFVNSETDPFVVDGTYLDILNDASSGGTVTLQNVNIRIFRS